MKRIFQIFLFLSITLSVKSQCAFGHEGNYTAYKLDSPPPYGSWIIVNDSVTFTLYNFFNMPDNVYNDTIVGKMNCTNDSVHFLPVGYYYGWYGFDFSGVGVFNQDTLVAVYKYILYDQYGPHTSYPQIINKEIPVDVESKYPGNFFQISPNPASNSIKITLPAHEEAREIHFYNVLGKEIILGTGKDIIDITSLSRGCYFIEVLTRNNKIYKRTLIKK